MFFLKKSLYGQWYLRFDRFMSEHSFQRCNFDGCVYFKILENDSKIYLLLYINDMLIANQSIEQINILKQQLREAFERQDKHKDLGAAKKILRVEIIRDKIRVFYA